MIGSQLGHFRVTAKLGAGGMGEVYRAEDTKLGREVAIKVLPDLFVSDPERMGRFEREARLLASLSHPNVAGIHEVGEQDGVHFLVLELAAGETLAARLDRGPVPTEVALALALQIAQGLEAAHERGIVHRDLKPANVMVDDEGRVKILDFGLAKAMDPGAGDAAKDAGLTASPTLTLGATVQGVILGTAAYMSPEQAAGATAGRSADIWSFGVVLYEMLSGNRLFEGETVSHVLAGVLKDEPDFSALPAGLPPRVRRLLGRCLRKKPRRRLQAIGDARIVLEEVLAGEEDEVVAASASDEGTAATPRAPLAIAAVAAVVGLGLGLLVGGRWLAPRSESEDALRLELAFPDGHGVFQGDGHTGIALSPDGRRIAMATFAEGAPNDSRLAVRDLGRLDLVWLGGTEGARAPFFSPDGEWIAYFTDDELLKVPASGGRPIALAGCDLRSRGGVWGLDGFIYFSQGTNDPVSRVPEDGGRVEPVTTLDESRAERTHRWPELTPDGTTLLYTSDTVASPTFYDDARIEAVRLDTGERHVVVEEASEARMLAADLLVYANAGNLFAIEVDPSRVTPRGRPVRLEQDVASSVGSGAVNFAVSRRGTAVWIAGGNQGALWAPLWLGRDGSSTPAELQLEVDVTQLTLSPDGRRVALRAGDARAGQTQDLWVGDLERGTVSRLTFDENANNPTWTPDGRRIAYQRDPSGESATAATGAREIAIRSADGSGDAEVLYSRSGENVGPAAFSPDGKRLVISRWSDELLLDLWMLSLDPPGEPVSVVSSPFEEFGADLSPDGRWIAYCSNESGRFEVYVRPFPEGSGKWQVSLSTGLEPRWSPDGTELFFRDEGGRLWRVEVEEGESFRATAPEQLLERIVGGRNARTYGVAPNGQSFLSLRLFYDEETIHAVAFADDWIDRARRAAGRGD